MNRLHTERGWQTSKQVNCMREERAPRKRELKCLHLNAKNGPGQLAQSWCTKTMSRSDLG